MFFNQLAGETWPGGEEACVYFLDPCRDHWAKIDAVIPYCQVLFFVQCRNLDVVGGC